MPRYEGTVKRTRPRVNVMRGYTGNEPQSLSRSAPVASDVTIYSGQAIADNGSGEWRLAIETDEVVYIAYHDSDDTDVKSCGKLLGFSALGSYELETAYTTDAGLAAATGPDLGVEVSNATAGSLTIAGAGDAAGTVVHGRTSTAAVDLSDGGRGGYTPLGQDDSSGSWGSGGSSATACDIDIDVTGQAADAADTYTITFTQTATGATFTTGTITYGGSAAAGGVNIKAAIDALQASDATFDSLIASTTDDSAGTIAVLSHAGAAGDFTAAFEKVSDADDDLDVTFTKNTSGADAVSSGTKNVLRWVTTAS